mmetsp:Transcript_31/g.86  ORF Transcript_31/g.86 Transcript_31/m.86 type:complete len:311 (+) Transcript_31:76-1008(+)
MEASSGSLPGKRLKRPNRSAAERRAQYTRAHARSTAQLLAAFASLQHRGNKPKSVHTRFVNALQNTTSSQSGSDQTGAQSVSSAACSAPPANQLHMKKYSFKQPPSTPSGPSSSSMTRPGISQQTPTTTIGMDVMDLVSTLQIRISDLQANIQSLCDNFVYFHTEVVQSIQGIDHRIMSLDTAIGIATSSTPQAYQQHHDLAELVDSATLERIRSLNVDSSVGAQADSVRIRRRLAGKQPLPATTDPYIDPVSNNISASSADLGHQVSEDQAAEAAAKLIQRVRATTSSVCQRCKGTGWISRFSKCSSCS